MRVKPQAAGLDPMRLRRISAWMQRYVETGRFPFAATLIARRSNLVWQDHCGAADIAAARPYQPDGLVRIYSMTKPVTSVALMMLYEQGLLHLDDPVSAYIPEFADVRVLIPGARRCDQTGPLATPVTLHHLLTHRAGLTYQFNDDPVAKSYAADKVDFWPQAGGLAATVARLVRQPLLFQPGERWNYSVATDVIGHIVEIVAGAPLDAYFARHILGPLGMTDTHFAVPPEKLSRLGPCYMLAPEGTLTEFPSDFAEGKVDTLSGGGGLISTGHDYLRFAEMLRGGGRLDGERLLGPHTVKLMTSNHLPGDLASMGPATWCETSFTGVGFGLGFAVNLSPAQSLLSASAGDFSWGGMASTYFWVDPAEELSVVFLTQLLPSSTWPNRKELRALVYQAITD
jgi:CubicO group peptidase (beta-lactamase class C family)